MAKEATANSGRLSESDFSKVETYPNNELTTVFAATVQATEEAIVNAMVAARDMDGDRGHKVLAIPHDGLREALRRYGRLQEPAE